MKKISSIVLMLTILAALFMSSGCTITGLIIGTNTAKQQHKKRPVIQPELNVINELEEGTWIDLVRKDSKRTIEGKFVSANADSIPIIKIRMRGKRANQMFRLSDIDHIVVGHKAKGPIILGTGLGLIVDGVAFAGGIVIMKALINSLIEAFF